MDQFQVIDSKGKPSLIPSPDNVASQRMDSIPKTLSAKDDQSANREDQAA